MKYHQREPIWIIRVLCPDCGTTHALIPSFSLPGTSHDTQSVETFLAGREQGLNRRDAGKSILQAGFDVRTLKRLERSFVRGTAHWQTLLLPDLRTGSGIQVFAIAADLGTAPGILVRANRTALSRRVNAVFNSRYSILLFTNHRTGRRIPHKLVSPRNPRPVLDSS